MATVYSLVCWGGRTGKAVIASNSSGLIFTLTSHGLRNGTQLQFTATTLPGNVSAGVTYYAKSLSANTFSIYTDAALTNRVAWGSSGSAVYAKSKKMLDFFLQYAGRWGDSGSERCYDGLASFNTARTAAATTTVSEFCELGEAFDDVQPAVLTMNIPAETVTIAPEVDGVKTEAWHGGNYGAGYRCFGRDEVYTNSLVLSGASHVLRDFSYVLSGNNNNGVKLSGLFNDFINMLVYATGGDSGQSGLSISTIAGKVINCLVAGINGSGISIGEYEGSGCSIIGNTVVKCTGTGFAGAANIVKHIVFSNLSVGNTGANWSAIPGNMLKAGNNAGAAGNTVWYTGTDTSIKTLVADNTCFVDFSGNNFRPASSAAPQVDSAIKLLQSASYDIAGNERPNYNNGGAEAFDVGCYEFDHGYGEHPATATISLTNVISGSRVLITRDDTSAVLYNDVPGSSLSLVTGYIGNFSVVIRKASDSPYYREFSAGGTTVADQTTSIKALQQLDE